MTTGHGMCARLITGLIVREAKTDRIGLGGKKNMATVYYGAVS